MPAFRYYYVKNDASTPVIATATPHDKSTVILSAPIQSGQSVRVDLFPWQPSEELHNLTLGVVAAEYSALSASAGNYFTYEPTSGMTLYTTASGSDSGLSLAFNGYGSDPAPPSQ